MSIKTPDLLWAQRAPHVFLKVNVPNVDQSSAVIDLTETSLHFHGKGGIDNSEYDATIEFFAPIDLEKSTKAISARFVVLMLVKKEEAWWARLCKEGKPRNVKVDWDNWKDEDDEDDDNGQYPNDFDMSQYGDMSQFGGMGGMGGMDGMNFGEDGGFGDMDNADIPDLEAPEDEEEPTNQEEKKEE
ncbi:putative Cell cycle regulatory protein wos2 [Blattamonas nauphoetae]|uniref:Cell cycle regulatory protein wos2 n=1 Tax=Blattamonas nauphoetae TaxID=2049346 RepID=A0ABQ9YMC6_9EUKA|nr:putative Cell cycle regulatory protein wos2 [Blattamonas nauphoetae]